MNHAFKDVMAFLNWTKVAIIYEEDYGKTWSSYEYSQTLNESREHGCLIPSMLRTAWQFTLSVCLT
jgi:hypothetical protein